MQSSLWRSARWSWVPWLPSLTGQSTIANRGCGEYRCVPDIRGRPLSERKSPVNLSGLVRTTIGSKIAQSLRAVFLYWLCPRESFDLKGVPTREKANQPRRPVVTCIEFAFPSSNTRGRTAVDDVEFNTDSMIGRKHVEVDAAIRASIHRDNKMMLAVACQIENPDQRFGLRDDPASFPGFSFCALLVSNVPSNGPSAPIEGTLRATRSPR